MADSSNRDLVNLDDETQAQDSDPGAGGNDTIINAAEMFQQQLEQMTQWKTQLSTQMEAMRGDGIKLLERQKALAVEKKRLAGEREDIGAQRKQLEEFRGEMDGQSKRLAQRAGELEEAQRQLAELQHQRELAERELAARQKTLTEQEGRHLAEDVRLRAGVEQLETERRHLIDLQRQADAERAQLDTQGRTLAQESHALEQRSAAVGGREEDVAAGRAEIAQAQAALAAREEELTQRQQALAERIRVTGEELDQRQAALAAAEQKLAQDRETFAGQKKDLRTRLEAFERAQAEQLEALATQTKRVTERRLEVEAAELDLAQVLESRIAQATAALQEELAQSRGGHDQRVVDLEQRLAQAESAAQALRTRETQLQEELATAARQLAALQDELQTAAAAAEKLAAERSDLGQKLAQLVEAAREDAARWERALEEARTQSAGGNQALESAQSQYETLKKDFKKLKARSQELQTAKDELEFQLEVRKEDFGKQLEAQREELSRQLAARDQEIADWKRQLAAAQTTVPAASMEPAAGAQHQEQIQALNQQLQILGRQRDELAGQLASVQEALRRQQEEALLAHGALEAQVQDLAHKNTALEAEKTAWQSKPQSVIRIMHNGAEASAGPAHRERLLRQARALRAFRLQVRDAQAGMETSRTELAQQREQIRARKENLEQVKRLLEKQEMVMARKLADHNAIKTVAAIGIFVIMVLASAFLGVYRFVNPVFRGEATMQLAPPQDLKGAELDTWLSGQMDYMRSNDVTYAAWKVLRNSDDHYVMHDVRDEWLASLKSHLTMQVDAPSRTLTLRYTGPDAKGVSQVCNALATAYTTPGMRDSSESDRAVGLDARIMAPAAAPTYPVDDNRMMISLCIVAGTLFVSLLLVMIFRHFVARQLKEIDQMADAQELDEVSRELPEQPLPENG